MATLKLNGFSFALVAAAVLCPLGAFGAANLTSNLLTVNTYCRGEDFNSIDVLSKIQAAVIYTEGFNLDVRNSTSSVTDVKALLDGLLQHPSELAVIHPGCSDNTAFLTDTSNYFNSTFVSYAFSSLPMARYFSNQLQMLPKETHLADGVIGLLEYFGWQRIVVLSEEAPIFASISNRLEEKLVGKFVNVTTSHHTDGISFPADNRIYLINSFPAVAREILCEGLNRSMFFPSYVWITYEWNEINWWKLSDHAHHAPSNCTDEEIEGMLRGSLAVSLHQTSQGEAMKKISVNFTSNYERLAYDSILALADLVNRSNFSEQEDQRALLDSITFHGASGSVSFREGIRQLDTLSIKQYRKDDGDLELVTFGRIPTTENEGFSYLPQEGNNTVWNGSGVPQDGTPLSVTNPPLLPLMVLLYAYATCGIVFAVVCLFFNFIFRDKKLIRLTSPNLNYMIILGAIIFYCSAYTFFHAPDTSTILLTVVCNFRLWLTALGFSLCYGPINAKMWRVYHICHKPNPSMKKLFVKDWHLMLIVAGFVAADVVMLSVITALGSSVRYSVHSIPDKERSDTTNSEGITITYRVDRCFSSSEVIFLPIIIGYKVILQAIGAFLAFNIRKVKIKGLNDSREISAILYITTIITIVITLVTFVFGDYINVDGTVYGVGICTGTTCVLTFIFIPKMIGLYKDPKGERIFSTQAGHNDTAAGKSQIQVGASAGDRTVITALEGRIKELECELAEKTKLSPNSTITSDDLEKETETTSLSQAE